MSEQSQSAAAAQGADAIHARAVEWLIAQDDAQIWSQGDQAGLDAWLNESSAHLLAYWRAKSGWKRTEVMSALRPFRPQPKQVPERWTRWRISMAVACAAVIAVAALVSIDWGKQRYVTYATAIGGHKTLALGDGSQIELNTDTVVRLPRGAGRRVILDRGEAFFQIRHDAANPFVVTTSTGRVVDLGTKFVIRQQARDVKVVLVEGRARFEGNGGEGEHRSVVLDPGDVVLASADRISLTKKPAFELKNELGWRHDMLIFRHVTLGDAAAEFNRYNTKKIVIGDPSAGRLEIRGTFHTEDVTLFARMAQKALGLRAIEQGNEITITR